MSPARVPPAPRSAKGGPTGGCPHLPPAGPPRAPAARGGPQWAVGRGRAPLVRRRPSSPSPAGPNCPPRPGPSPKRASPNRGPGDRGKLVEDAVMHLLERAPSSRPDAPPSPASFLAAAPVETLDLDRFRDGRAGQPLGRGDHLRIESPRHRIDGPSRRGSACATCPPGPFYAPSPAPSRPAPGAPAPRLVVPDLPALRKLRDPGSTSTP